MTNENTDHFVVERDLRLDLLRGVGLWMIFIDHIPDDVVSWLTLRNYGFCDAAEFFVFISGYLLGFIYAPIVAAGQFMPALKRLWLRAWHMYVAHLLLFLVFTAQIARAARRFDNPLWCLVRRPNLTMIGSVVVYVLARYFDWNLPSYPAGATWYFNPFAWQLLFFFAAWCGRSGGAQIKQLHHSRAVLVVAIGWILFAFVIAMSWHSAFLESFIPKWLFKVIYPIDKTDLDMFRFTHFLAFALIISRYLHQDWAGLQSKWLRPLILCGQHSLPLFCLGVFLSFGAHWILVQWKSAFIEQFAVSFAGFAIMTAVAWLLNRAERVPDLFVDAGFGPKSDPGTLPGRA